MEGIEIDSFLRRTRAAFRSVPPVKDVNCATKAFCWAVDGVDDLELPSILAKDRECLVVQERIDAK